MTDRKLDGHSLVVLMMAAEDWRKFLNLNKMLVDSHPYVKEIESAVTNAKYVMEHTYFSVSQS